MVTSPSEKGRGRGRGVDPVQAGRPTGDTVAFLTNIPNGFNDELHQGLRARGMDVRVRYEGLPGSIGRPWALTPRPPDRVARNLWQERDAFVVPPRPHLGAIILGGWADLRAVQRRVAAMVSHRGPARPVLYWGEPMNVGGTRSKELARRAFFSRHGLDAVLAIGSHAVRSYREATGGGVPIHVFPYTTSRGRDVVAEPPDQPTVGYAGRLIGWKNVGVVIRAIATMAPADRPVFEVIGSGPDEGELRVIAKRLAVDVRFAGEVPPADVAGLRRRWSVTVQPSRENDGWAMAVPESLNSGVPVVASGHVGAAVDIVRDGTNGGVVPRDDVDDPDAWADAVAPWLGRVVDPDVIRSMAEPFLPDRAAAWLADVLRSGSTIERSFVGEAWAGFDDLRSTGSGAR